MTFLRSAGKSRALGLLIAVGLAGACQPFEQPLLPPPADEPTPAPSSPAARQPDRALYALLDAAEAALKVDNLTYPYDGSAWQLYETALRSAPDNAEAARGIERIAERYVALAMQAAEQQSFATAKSMVQRAKLVNPANPTIDAVTAQIHLLETARRRRVVLDKQLVSARSMSISQSLRNLGSAAREPNCRVTIDARSDDEGRWLYKMLNQAPGDRRIRATMQIASPPSVHLLCFDTASLDQDTSGEN